MATDGTTFINPLGLSFTLLMGLLLVILPRRVALVPVIILTCYMTMGQRVIILGLDFTMIRILVLFGWLRLILRREFSPIRLNAIDKAILLWVLSSIVTYTLLWQTSEALINRLGLAYNAVGMYFLFRFLVRDLDEALRVFRILAILIVPLAFLMLVEKSTGRNAFAVFGGIPEWTLVRDGVLRCQGPFGHPILAGSFGATLLPLFVGLWHQGGRSRAVSAIAIVAATVIAVTAHSSTPVLAYLAGFVGLCMWPLRAQMRMVRWGLVLMLIGLHVVMKAPVWFLLDRVADVIGGHGYHRAYLIEQAFANLSDWWLLGTETTANWGYRLFDVTNQYLRVGADGGVITMMLFILVIVRCFVGIGRALRATLHESGAKQHWLWAMGAALFAHVVTFFGVSYWDQNIVLWYLLLATISTASGLVAQHSQLPSPEPIRSERTQLALGSSLRG